MRRKDDAKSDIIKTFQRFSVHFVERSDGSVLLVLLFNRFSVSNGKIIAINHDNKNLTNMEAAFDLPI